MEELQEEKALKKYSWCILFAVTSFSSFIFFGALKILDGSHSVFFLKTGIVSLLISLFLWFLNRPARPRARKEPGTVTGLIRDEETNFQ